MIGHTVSATAPRFTLIELLVVVAIISVLAAMLLPALGKAKERSRRSVCISNLKQQYLGAVTYYDEQDGQLPWVATAWVGTQERQDASLSFGRASMTTSPAVYDQDSGLAAFVTQGYIPLDILSCPSKGAYWDWARNPMTPTRAHQIASATGLVQSGYGYRFNHKQVWDYTPRALERPGVPGSAVLFWDASSRARANNNQALSIPGTIPYQPIVTTDKFYRWAHSAGGHMVGYDGAVKWIPNFLSAGTNKDAPRSWPSYEWGYGQTWLNKEERWWVPTGYDTLYHEQ